MPKADLIQAIVASIEASPLATIVTDNRQPDNPILAANAAFSELTGYTCDEVVGRNCRFLGGAGSEPEAQSVLRRAVAEGRPAVAELWNYRKDGTPFRNAVMVAPVRDHSGETHYFVGTQMEVHKTSSRGSGLYHARRRVLALTSKQRQVLKLMARGYRAKQIGEELGVGESAVKRLRGRLLQSLGVPSTADAIRIGIQADLVP